MHTRLHRYMHITFVCALSHTRTHTHTHTHTHITGDPSQILEVEALCCILYLRWSGMGWMRGTAVRVPTGHVCAMCSKTFLNAWSPGHVMGVNVCVRVCVCVCVFVCVCVCVCVCMYVWREILHPLHVYVCIYVCIYVRTSQNTHRHTNIIAHVYNLKCIHEHPYIQTYEYNLERINGRERTYEYFHIHI